MSGDVANCVKLIATNYATHPGIKEKMKDDVFLFHTGHSLFRAVLQFHSMQSTCKNTLVVVSLSVYIYVTKSFLSRTSIQVQDISPKEIMKSRL